MRTEQTFTFVSNKLTATHQNFEDFCIKPIVLIFNTINDFLNVKKNNDNSILNPW